MKANEPDDKSLRGLLREWRVDAALPPRFREELWHRVDRAQEPVPSSSWWGVLGRWLDRWINARLPRPAPAICYVTVLLAIGVTAGWTQGRLESIRLKDELGQRYVRTLDPYFTPVR